MMLILTSMELGANLYYIGVNYALDEIGYSYGTNMIATGLCELAAYILLSITFIIIGFIITKLPKK